MSDRALMLSLLQQMEDSMRAISLWEGVSPPATAFASELPFCVDTLRFSQWLQWVFIARFRALLEGNLPLPVNCNIATMAEEAFRDMAETEMLLGLLRQFDALFDS
ncbi:MAG: YqcC family protein [Gammaproteobacteria bacterium]|jgi:uncharacterized protein YqcC (DUF446 family)